MAYATSTAPYSNITGCTGCTDNYVKNSNVTWTTTTTSTMDSIKKQIEDVQKQAHDCSSIINDFYKQWLKTNDYGYGVTMTTYTGNITTPREKDEKEMNVMPNFNFGPCGERAKISPLGIAIQNSNNEWVSYDKDNDQIVNVDLINFGGHNFVYMIPVALKDVAIGDAVIHNKHIMFVNKVKENCLSVIDVTDGEYKKILPTKSIFGFDFITKIVSLIDFSASAANEDNPFGNILPFLLLDNSNNDYSGLTVGSSKKDDSLPLALMLLMAAKSPQGQSVSEESLSPLMNCGSMTQQSLLMAMLLSNQKMGNSLSDLLPLLMLSGNMFSSQK